MKKEKVQWMLATNIVKNSRNFVDTSTSKSYHPAGAHAHDRAMKMLKLDCTLQFIEAYQTMVSKFTANFAQGRGSGRG